MLTSQELKVLKTIRDVLLEEIDMDTVSPKLGSAINELEELIDKVTLFDRQNAYGDQSKW